MPSHAKKIIVIGSGFGGLAAAIRLAVQGHDVELFEQRDQLGGRAYVYRQDGFTFDGGPTVITAPLMLDELLKAADGHFAHDVIGIGQHIDRKTGRLMDHFRPRHAARHLQNHPQEGHTMK